MEIFLEKSLEKMFKNPWKKSFRNFLEDGFSDLWFSGTLVQTNLKLKFHVCSKWLCVFRRKFWCFLHVDMTFQIDLLFFEIFEQGYLRKHNEVGARFLMKFVIYIEFPVDFWWEPRRGSVLVPGGPTVWFLVKIVPRFLKRFLRIYIQDIFSNTFLRFVGQLMEYLAKES